MERLSSPKYHWVSVSLTVDLQLVPGKQNMAHLFLSYVIKCSDTKRASLEKIFEEKLIKPPKLFLTRGGILCSVCAALVSLISPLMLMAHVGFYLSVFVFAYFVSSVSFCSSLGMPLSNNNESVKICIALQRLNKF